jgi:hypothetical protein
LLIALLKLWATSDQATWAIGPSRRDDLHFLLQASYLALGQWLGPYDQFTLIKGPLFPAWMALMWQLGVPLLLSSQLLYASSCVVLAWSLRPFFSRRSFTPIFFAFVLLNPYTFSASTTRVDRELIAPALTALVSASAIRLTLAQGRMWPGRAWAAGLGISFAALWLTREERVVVLPFLTFLFGAALWRAIKSRRAVLLQLSALSLSSK